jgi:hypothetical protein
MDVPREPQRVRKIVTAIGVEWRPDGGGDYADGEGHTDWAVLIRDEGPLTVELAARPEREKPVWQGSRTTPDLVEYGDQLIGYLANVASECMQDNLGDAQTVHDMHDMIGGLSSLRSALQLIRTGEARNA